MDAADLADRVSATAPAPGWVVLVTAVLGIVISLAQVLEFSTVARSLNVLDTLVHESGHAAVAILTSGRVHRLELDTTRSGTTSSSTIVGVRSVLTSAAGYAAVPLAGLGAAGLLAHGHAAGVVALLGVLALVVLPIARGMITLITVLALVVLSGLLVWLDLAALHLWVAHLIASVLLCSGITSLLPLVLNRMHGTTSGHDDAETLRRDTGVPGPVWIAAWTGLAGWCLWLGAGLLWPF